MEVTALCIRLMINVMLLLLEQVHQSCFHNADVTFPRVVVSRLQLFEYDSVSVTCEGFFNELVEWRVMRKIMGIATTCNTKWETKGSCTIDHALSMDDGEYWCEAGGKKSSVVSIKVTTDSVLLESPAVPVMEGESVTLRCRNKTTSNFIADFYKNSQLVNTSSTDEMTIHGVSKSDEGLYKCRISGVGESPESWLSVQANSVTLESPALPVMEGDAVTLCCKNKKTSKHEAVFYKDGRLLIGPSSTGKMNIRSVSKSDEGLYKCNISDVGESTERWLAVREHQADTSLPATRSRFVFALLWIIITILLVALLLLFMLILHYMNLKGSSVPPPSIPMISFQQTESAETSVANLRPTTCAVIANQEGVKETSPAEQQSPIYAVITNPKERKEENEPLKKAVYYTLSMGPGVSRATPTPFPSVEWRNQMNDTE